MNKITLNDIGGYEFQKDEAIKIINFFKSYDEFIKNGASLPRGIIFYGRPGNGKTMIAKAIAYESNVKLYSLTDERFNSDIDISASIKNTFALAKKNAPSIVLIDELDQLVNCDMGFGAPSSDKQREVLRILLTEIDKLDGTGVLVLATTNKYIDAVPSALVRNGRIEKHISFSNPDFDDRKEIFNIYLSKSKIFKKISSIELAKMTNGLTCSAIATLVNDVLIKCLTNKNDVASYIDFYEPLQCILSNGIKKKPKKNNDHVIFHEIGHLIVNYVLKGNVGSISTESFGDSGGRFASVNKDIRDLITLDDLYNEGAIAAAGLAATEVFLGKKCLGASSDLQIISNCCMTAINNGLLKTKGKLVSAQSFVINEWQRVVDSKELASYQQKFLDKCYCTAYNIINENLSLGLKFYEILKKKHFMSSEEVNDVLKNEHVNKVSTQSLTYANSPCTMNAHKEN